jgi:hypothetical protein
VVIEFFGHSQTSLKQTSKDSLFNRKP